MRDAVGYVLLLAMVVVPSYGCVELLLRIVAVFYENQSVLLSMPFP
jgi:hypothetical protein